MKNIKVENYCIVLKDFLLPLDRLEIHFHENDDIQIHYNLNVQETKYGNFKGNVDEFLVYVGNSSGFMDKCIFLRELK